MTLQTITIPLRVFYRASETSWRTRSTRISWSFSTTSQRRSSSSRAWQSLRLTDRPLSILPGPWTARGPACSTSTPTSSALSPATRWSALPCTRPTQAITSSPHISSRLKTSPHSGGWWRTEFTVSPHQGDIMIQGAMIQLLGVSLDFLLTPLMWRVGGCILKDLGSISTLMKIPWTDLVTWVKRYFEPVDLVSLFCPDII